MSEVGEVGEIEAPKRSGRPRRVIVRIALLVAALAIALTVLGIRSRPDLPVGSRHRATVMVGDYTGNVAQGACWNNISDVRVGDHHWSTDAHAPDQWPVGEVDGWLEITAPPSNGPTATFTADEGGSVDFSGGASGTYFNDLSCHVGPG